MQEHRSTFYLPYWNIPFSDVVVPRLREFKANLDVIDTQLDDLISLAVNTKQEDDIEALQVLPSVLPLCHLTPPTQDPHAVKHTCVAVVQMADIPTAPCHTTHLL
jgi:hypothetical protein